MNRTFVGLLALALLVSQAAAEPALEGRVRLASGEPAAGARLLLFDLADLRLPPAGATTDASGRFTLPAGASSSSSVRALPRRIHLGPNYPNPFNPATIIPYELPTPGHVRLEVFNLVGQRIATLVDGPHPAGYHTARWQATDAAGRAVAAGIYLYRLRGEGVSLTGRMVLVDGQAGVAAGVASGVVEPGRLAPLPAYGLVVSGAGLTPYVEPAFQVPAEGAVLDIAVQASRGPPVAKRASSAAEPLLGDVDNNGRVDVTDALLVALYSIDPSTVMPNEGDIALGDVNADGQVDITDAWLLMIHSVDPSHPLLPADIGSPVAPKPPYVGSKIYWADWTTDRIQRSNRDGSNVEDVVTGLITPSGVTVDGSGGKLYWTDAGTDRVQRSNLDGSRIEDLVTTGLAGPRGLVVDGGAGKLYWADSGTDKIQRCNLDGSQVEDLVTTGLVTPTGLALDPAGGKLYWADAGTDRIQRSNLDGSRIEDLVTAGLVTPIGLAVDPVGGKLYWTDYGTDRIQRSNLDGSEVEDLITAGLVTPRGLAVDVEEGKLYWTDSGRDRIQRSNLDGTGVELLVSTGLATPVALALLDGSPVVDRGGFPERPAYQFWELPEGALARLGKGWIGDSDRAVAYSPDGDRLAVASSIGIWLYDGGTGAEVDLFTGHVRPVTSVAFSPDGATLASGSQDATLRLWDVVAGQLQATLEGHQGPIASVAFSPEGATLASAGGERTFRLWDVASGQTKATLQANKVPRSVAFSPDGATLVGASAGSREFREGSMLQVWDVPSGRPKALQEGVYNSVFSVAFSPDGATLAAAGESNSVGLWDVTAGHWRATLTGRTDWDSSQFAYWPSPPIYPVNAVAFSADGMILASCSSYEKAVHLWTSSSGELMRTLPLGGRAYKGTSVAFSPKGTDLATASADNIVRLWDVADGSVRTGLAHSSGIRSLAVSPDGSTVANAEWREIRLWEVASGQLKASLPTDEHATSVAFSPDGGTLASSDGLTIRLWDAASGQPEAVLESHVSTVERLAFSPDGSTLISVGSWPDSTVYLWDVPSRLPRATLKAQSLIVSLAISPDGATLASGGGPLDPSIRLWNPADGQPKAIIEEHTDRVDRLAFSPDGATLASASSFEKRILLWDVASGQIKATLWQAPQDVMELAFSPDGTTLASGSRDGTVRLWDVAGGQRRATLEGHTSAVRSLVFSPDGSVLASSGWGHDPVLLWDVALGQLKAFFAGHSDQVLHLAFTPDSAILATGSWDGTILLWDMAPYLSGGPGRP